MFFSKALFASSDSTTIRPLILLSVRFSSILTFPSDSGRSLSLIVPASPSLRTIWALWTISPFQASRKRSVSMDWKSAPPPATDASDFAEPDAPPASPASRVPRESSRTYSRPESILASRNASLGASSAAEGSFAATFAASRLASLDRRRSRTVSFGSEDAPSTFLPLMEESASASPPEPLALAGEGAACGLYEARAAVEAASSAETSPLGLARRFSSAAFARAEAGSSAPSAPPAPSACARLSRETRLSTAAGAAEAAAWDATAGEDCGAASVASAVAGRVGSRAFTASSLAPCAFLAASEALGTALAESAPFAESAPLADLPSAMPFWACDSSSENRLARPWAFLPLLPVPSDMSAARLPLSVPWIAV